MNINYLFTTINPFFYYRLTRGNPNKEVDKSN